MEEKIAGIYIRVSTQEQVAEIINCSQTAYSKYELGKREIPLGALISLAKYYKTSIDYIVGLTNVKEPYKRGI